jgi:hypothetical protein
VTPKARRLEDRLDVFIESDPRRVRGGGQFAQVHLADVPFVLGSACGQCGDGHPCNSKKMRLHSFVK